MRRGRTGQDAAALRQSHADRVGLRGGPSRSWPDAVCEAVYSGAWGLSDGPRRAEWTAVRTTSLAAAAEGYPFPAKSRHRFAPLTGWTPPSQQESCGRALARAGTRDGSRQRWQSTERPQAAQLSRARPAPVPATGAGGPVQGVDHLGQGSSIRSNRSGCVPAPPAGRAEGPAAVPVPRLNFRQRGSPGRDFCGAMSRRMPEPPL